MNSKRQTIWLVSMLSLMVVLSAYYLFTEDVNEIDTAAPTGTFTSEEIVIDDITAQETADEEVAEEYVADVSAEPGAEEDVAASTSEDANILEMLEQGSNLTAEDYFATMQMERNENFDKEYEKLMTIITEGDAEAQAKAYEDMHALEEKDNKISQLEEQLMQEYSHALVSEQNGTWKVSIKADSLEKSDAASIANMLIKELGVHQSDIVINMVH
ncbi:SpoIIIAH-like family protein [Marinicrinis lubricantis]|uniref:SpoIIIAH-like family protein n=1 Tax=Marinicrinis lubricantis TaxID=2086470 RepID=A0ABW1IRT0_9BACL